MTAGGLSDLQINNNMPSQNKLDFNAKNTKSFNLFLSSVKSVIDNSSKKRNMQIIEPRSKDITNSIYYNKFQYDLSKLYELAKSIFIKRLKTEKNSLDAISLNTALDLANALKDHTFASYIWQVHNDLRIPHSSRVFHSYLRSFQNQNPLQIETLHKLITNFITTSNLDLDSRTCDEIINACNRVAGLTLSLTTIDYLSTLPNSGNRNINRPLIISFSALTNLFICFDNTWRHKMPLNNFDINFGREQIESHSKELIKMLNFKTNNKFNKFYWVTIISIFICRKDFNNLSRVLNGVLSTNHPQDVLMIIEYSILLALDPRLTFLTQRGYDASELLFDKLNELSRSYMYSDDGIPTPKSVNKIPSLTAILNTVPNSYFIYKFNHRIFANVSTIMDFVEFVSTEHPSKSKILFRLSFLESVLSEIIEKDSFKQGARLVKALQFINLQNMPELSLLNNQSFKDIKAVVGRKWAAKLLASSLGSKKSNLLKTTISLLKKDKKFDTLAE